MKQQPSKSFVAVIWLFIFGLVGLVIYAANRDQPNSPTDQSSAKPQTIDLTNAAELEEKYGVEAALGCSNGADNYLRSVAKYDFKWDDIGVLEMKFDKYLKQAAAPGVLVMNSDKVKLQNGFGAYQHVELRCSYDTQSKKVLSYSIKDNE